MRRNMSLEENCMISLITPVLGQRGGGRGSNMAHLRGYIVPASLRVRRQRNGDDLPAGHDNYSLNFRITASPERLTYYQKFVVLKIIGMCLLIPLMNKYLFWENVSSNSERLFLSEPA